MKELPIRKKIRLQGYDYSKPGYYFVTICVEDGHEILGTFDVGATVPGRPPLYDEHLKIKLTPLGITIKEILDFTNDNIVRIDKYIIMPNHIHMIIVLKSKAGIGADSAGDRGRSPLQYVVRNIKSYITKQAGYSIWQKSFYDRIIRSRKEYENICKYIEENPQKWKDIY